MQEQNEAALIARSRDGDTAAFEALIVRHERVLFRVALRMLGDYADASDATQATFIKVYEKLDTFDPRFRFFSWIYRILLNECLNTRRNRHSHEEITPDVAVCGPVDALEVGERRRRVQRALLELPDEYRAVVVLRHFGELSYDDIGATLGIPAKTVKSRLYTARQRLVELLVGEKIGR